MVYVPEAYDPDVTAPLAYVFHGAASNKEAQFRYSHFPPYADADGALLVLPDALGSPKRWSPIGPAFSGVEGVNDLAFFDDLSAEIERSFCVDTARRARHRHVQRRLHGRVGRLHALDRGLGGGSGDRDGVGRTAVRDG